MSHAPTVMVSSTFYDLKQLRTDLHTFLSDELGYTALLSEFPTFPVDPSADAVENCRRRVEKDADILVLVVGSRYGTVDLKTSKSVTNIEYLAARAKGIPIYVFIEKAILNVLPVWQANPTADFGKVVDSLKLFEFVETIRSDQKVWTTPFETAQDIVDGLRIQLAWLFKDSLAAWSRVHGSGLPDHLLSIGHRALRIALEKETAWEYRLFLQVWSDETKKHLSQLRQYRSGIAISVSETVAEDNAIPWILTRFHELTNFAESATHLLNVSAVEAFGKPGEPGDAEHIIWVAQALGKILETLLERSLATRCAMVVEPFASVVGQIVLAAEGLIEELFQFPLDSAKKIAEALLVASEANPIRLELQIVFRLKNENQLSESIEELRRRFE